jgi:curved DNA-binding protein CbpA
VAIDLYAELGVTCEATAAEIRRAYRRRAKHVHPDAGGSPESFERLQLAHDILSDPEKRRIYDEAGTIEAPRADNADAAAFGLIGQLLAAFLGEEAEPHQIDLRHHMIQKARELLTGVNNALAKSSRAAARAKKLMGRFKVTADGSPTPMEAMLQHQIALHEAAVEKHTVAKSAFVRVIEILETWDFEREGQPQTFMRAFNEWSSPLYQQSAFYGSQQSPFFSNRT